MKQTTLIHSPEQIHDKCSSIIILNSFMWNELQSFYELDNISYCDFISDKILSILILKCFTVLPIFLSVVTQRSGMCYKGENNFFFKFVSYIQQIPLTNKMLLKLVFK